MNPDVSIPLLVHILACAIALGLMHVVASRCSMSTTDAALPQVGLVRLIMLLNFPLLIGIGAIAWFEGRSFVEAFSMLIFGSVVYYGFAYAYFHVLNMSETARRIRILLYVLTHDKVNAEGLRGAYSPRDMVAARLDRLERMGQIARGPDGRFRVASRSLLFAAHTIRVWRLMLRLERRRIIE